MSARRHGRPKRSRHPEDPAFSFEPGRVFKPADGRESEFRLDLEVATYRAQKGQAGNRGHGGGGPHPCGCRCNVCVDNSSFHRASPCGARHEG